MTTTVGWCSAMASRTSVASSVWSACRGTVRYVVWVLRAYSGYIEYVGVNDSTERPGPPNALSTCTMTSFEPFAAHTISGVTP